MYKIITQIKRKPGISQQEFRDYYESSHRHLVKYLAHHIVRYTRSYPVEGFEDVTDAFHHPAGWVRPGRDYDVLTEVWVRDAAGVREMYRLVREPEANAAIRADEPKFMDQASITAVVCEECTSNLEDYL